MRSWILNNSQFCFIIIITISVFSCAKKINQVPDKINWDVSHIKKTVRNKEKLDSLITTYTSQTIDKSSMNRLIDSMIVRYPNNDKKIKSRFEKIEKEYDKIDNELSIIKQKASIIIKKINNDVLSHRKDSLFNVIIKNRNIKDKKKINNAIMDDIINEIRYENNEYISKVNKEILALNEEHITIINRSNSFAFLILSLDDELKYINSIVLNAQNNVFFKTGLFELDDDNLEKFRTEVLKILVSLNSRLNALKIKSKLNKDLTGIIYFKVDGYADTVPFKYSTKGTNEILSKKRAQYINTELSKIVVSFFGNNKIENINFKEPVIEFEGHGIKIPNDLLSYKPIGRSDKNRRLIKISWKFDFN